MEEVIATFTASLRSVGTACTLAGVGMYLHRRGFIVGEGKRTLALISQQVTIPLLLFTKIVYCNQNWSTDPCPSITTSLGEVWMILFWPIYVCGCGLAVGWVVAKVCNTPPKQIRSVLAVCGFANSTGLPITLLTVIHQNFPTNCELGRIDPTIFLSVYLILYPVLQWGLGGWILCPEEEEEESEDKKEDLTIPPPVVIEGDDSNNQKQQEDIVVTTDESKNGTTTTTAPTPTAVGGYVRACLKVTQDGDVSLHSCHLNQKSRSNDGGGEIGMNVDGNEHNHNNGNDEEAPADDAPPTSPHMTSTQRHGNFLKSSSFLGGGDGTTPSQRFQHNVLNNTKVSKWYKHLHEGLGDTDAALYISSANLNEMYPSQIDEAVQAALVRAGISVSSDMDQMSIDSTSTGGGSSSTTTGGGGDRFLIIESDSEAALNEMIKQSSSKKTNRRIHSLSQIAEPSSEEFSEQTPLIGSSGGGVTTTTHYTIVDNNSVVVPPPVSEITTTMKTDDPDQTTTKHHHHDHHDHKQHKRKSKRMSVKELEKRAKRNLTRQSKMSHRSPSFQEDPKVTVGETLRKISQRCLQPPVVGALLGITVASISWLRGIFVDLVTRSSDAPLQWFFDGLYSVGLSAVPINMMILGCNLSASNLFSLDTFRQVRSDNNTDKASSSKDDIDNRTIAGIVIGKMIVLPIIGILSCVFLKNYVWHIPEDIDAPYYLVLMIVFITPTANNVMVMVELSGSASKEGMARVIGLQYLCAPIMLSLSVTGVVHVASQWMEHDTMGNIGIVQGETYGRLL